jgi:hypothetical protein
VGPQVRYLHQVRNEAGYGFVQFHAVYDKSLKDQEKENYGRGLRGSSRVPDPGRGVGGDVSVLASAEDQAEGGLPKGGG